MIYNTTVYNGGTDAGPLSQPRPGGRLSSQPTRNLLRNVVSLMRLTVPNADVDGAQQNSWTVLATNVRCSVQPGSSDRNATQGEIRQSTPYTILFDTNPSLTNGDQVQWLDDRGILHLITATGCRNMVGRGAAFMVTGEEAL